MRTSSSQISFQRPVAIAAGVNGLNELRLGLIKTAKKIKYFFDAVKCDFLENNSIAGTSTHLAYKTSRKESQEKLRSISFMTIGKHFIKSAVSFSACLLLLRT